MNKFNCIKCSQQYETEDVEAYYCSPCNEAKKILAEEIDRKIGSTVGQEPKGELKAFDEFAKKGGARNVHVNIKDLGIRF